MRRILKKCGWAERTFIILMCIGAVTWGGVILTSFTGCAALGIGDSQQEIRKAYAMAVVTYVDMAEVYADAYDTAAPEVQVKWKATVTPRVLQASEALRIWGQALESTDARAAADRAISDVVILLVDMGMITIK